MQVLASIYIILPALRTLYAPKAPLLVASYRGRISLVLASSPMMMVSGLRMEDVGCIGTG